ncbi:unnamed protein product [Caenorhabditis angaria]|uniref:G-protein coupled receptors family 1 profile domain-containing protein n=1 Tax=Caenorhabditis angaria TaxID=860376 RepID=A0A9P1N3U6_9PELO|nr:unnamed protein product [Caenorhabditis angaria]
MLDYIPKELLPLGIFLFFCALIGVIGNLIMLIVVVRTKRFRSPCHVLIAITCVADAIHISGQFPFCVHLFGNLTSTQAQCYFMLTGPIVGLTTGGPLILAMGIDRLIAVKFPTRYRYYQEEPRSYIIVQLIFPISYAVTFLIYGFWVRDSNVKNQIICSNPLALRDTAFQMFTYSSGIIYVFVGVIYLSVYCLLKSNKASARFKSVFRSLAVTVGIVVFGWVTTTVANTLSYNITSDTYTAQLIQMYAGITVNSSAAANIFVFYFINAEYRGAIRLLFGIKAGTGPMFEASSTMVTKVKKGADPISESGKKRTNTVSNCYFQLFIPLLGLTGAGPLILAMGVDRLIAVKFPTKYRQYTEEPRKYVMFHLIFPVLYIGSCMGYGYETKLTDPKVQITCAVPLGLWGAAFQFFTYTSALIYALVVIVYLTVYILLKSSSASARFKSVFKSISITVGLVVFGWVTTTVANTLSYEVTSDEFLAIVIQMYAGVSVNLAATSNVFVFYWINSEYREVIKSILGLKNKAKTINFEASTVSVHPNRKQTMIA